MTQATIEQAILALGHGPDGWAASERDGILIWLLDAPQPTEEELVAAGWVKAGA